MKAVELTFLQRFKLTDLLSQQEGPLGRTAPFLRVLNIVRFDDAEAAKITATKVSETQVRFEAPTLDFGTRKIELENADANALTELMNSWPKFTTADHAWADPILAQLA